MSQSVLIETKPLDIDRSLLIVVGAHLRAEVFDRPVAYRLRDRIRGWIDGRTRRGEWIDVAQSGLDIMVCTDLWYLNNLDLMERPSIVIGAPGINAASAWLAGRIPAALTLDGSLQIHLDIELTTLKSCVWGVNPSATHDALSLFERKYLDRFLLRAHGEPVEESAAP